MPFINQNSSKFLEHFAASSQDDNQKSREVVIEAPEGFERSYNTPNFQIGEAILHAPNIAENPGQTFIDFVQNSGNNSANQLQIGFAKLEQDGDNTAQTALREQPVPSVQHEDQAIGPK